MRNSEGKTDTKVNSRVAWYEENEDQDVESNGLCSNSKIGLTSAQLIKEGRVQRP